MNNDMPISAPRLRNGGTAHVRNRPMGPMPQCAAGHAHGRSPCIARPRWRGLDGSPVASRPTRSTGRVSPWFGLATGHDSRMGDLPPWCCDGEGAEQGRRDSVCRRWGTLAILGGLGSSGGKVCVRIDGPRGEG
jgi:hypothetical protein